MWNRQILSLSIIFPGNHCRIKQKANRRTTETGQHKKWKEEEEEEERRGNLFLQRSRSGSSAELQERVLFFTWVLEFLRTRIISDYLLEPGVYWFYALAVLFFRNQEHWIQLLSICSLLLLSISNMMIFS